MTKGISSQAKNMDLEKICNEILQSDKDVMLVAVSHRAEYSFKEREGVKSFETKEDIEKSLADASLRWVTRRSHRELGEPIYAMAKYEKVKRITAPLGRYGIILCVLLPTSDAEKIATNVIKLVKKYSDS
jgi:hypothetical protein